MMDFAQALDSMIICNTEKNASGQFTNPCGFDDLIRLTQIVINNLIVISVVLATIAFVYIGFVFLTSGGDTGAKEKAKHSAMSLLKGFAAIILAWFVIYLITSVLLKDGYSLLK